MHSDGVPKPFRRRLLLVRDADRVRTGHGRAQKGTGQPSRRTQRPFRATPLGIRIGVAFGAGMSLVATRRTPDGPGARGSRGCARSILRLATRGFELRIEGVAASVVFRDGLAGRALESVVEVLGVGIVPVVLGSAFPLESVVEVLGVGIVALGRGRGRIERLRGAREGVARGQGAAGRASIRVAGRASIRAAGRASITVAGRASIRAAGRASITVAGRASIPRALCGSRVARRPSIVRRAVARNPGVIHLGRRDRNHADGMVRGIEGRAGAPCKESLY